MGTHYPNDFKMMDSNIKELSVDIHPCDIGLKGIDRFESSHEST